MEVSKNPFDLRFSGELESAFQKENYENSRNFMRGAGLLFGLMALGLTFHFLATQPLPFVLIPLSALVLWLLIFGLTLWPNFWRVWQPVLTLLFILAECSLITGAAHNIQIEPGYGDLIARVSWLSASCMMFMVTMATMRLNYPYAAALYSCMALTCGFLCLRLYGAPPGVVLDRFSLGIFIVWPTLIYLSYTHERLHRAAFWARTQLAEKEAAERNRREQSESMLRVLSHAIGGIVHDLGNPLTLVQTGLQVLEFSISKGKSDAQTLALLMDGMHNGARMLNLLRVSLIEQTRVLDGQPIPVTLQTIPLRPLIEAGARFQKPIFARGREISLEGEDVEVQADEIKLTTAFMNLIGNALKYSDGPIRVSWHLAADWLLVAVQDRGENGRGLSREQAGCLFVAFARLDGHCEIEGTGLGLLSVQKIVEAHGGETFIEGRSDGVFSTAKFPHPPQVEEEFQTAFVIALPCKAMISAKPLGLC